MEHEFFTIQYTLCNTQLSYACMTYARDGVRRLKSAKKFKKCGGGRVLPSPARVHTRCSDQMPALTPTRSVPLHEFVASNATKDTVSLKLRPRKKGKLAMHVSARDSRGMFAINFFISSCATLRTSGPILKKSPPTGIEPARVQICGINRSRLPLSYLLHRYPYIDLLKYK